MKIWAHVICQNEENYIWFALMSVVSDVEKIMVWDTGSDDLTVALVQDVMDRYPNKIEFRQCGKVDGDQLTKLRQEMLDQSKCDWILIVDGDEVWWKGSLSKLISFIQKNGKKLAAIVVPYKVPVGDIYHFQSESAGQYQLMGKKGYLTIRAINRKISGLTVKNKYPLEGYVDGEGVLLQNRNDLGYLDAPYLHLTHLERSSKKRVRNTQKIELGKYVGEEFEFPEVFYIDKPATVPSPWRKIGWNHKGVAFAATWLRNLKRRIRR